MTAASHSPLSSDWRDLASLGEQLVSAPSLAAQRDRIIAMTSRLVDGSVDVWLQENLFRLPNIEEEPLFPEQPSAPGMQRALRSGKISTKQRRDRKNGASRETWAAVPLEDQGIVLGALQVTRAKGPEFRQEELDVLEGLAGVIVVSLVASHRAAVERFRLNQLHLVSEVSAQIANVLNLDELAKRVTKLIQQTFHYYYVAIFTLRDRSTAMRYRASAMSKISKIPRQSGPRSAGASRKGKRRSKTKSKVALEVEVGQGLIGQAAAEGERIVIGDVRKDPRYRFIDALPKTRSEAVIPLRIEDRVLGVLDVQSDQINAFHPNDLLILGALADTIARAVEGTRLYNNLRRRADELTLISEVSKSVTSSLELGKLMKDVANLIHDRFRFPYVQLFTVHPNRGLIEYQAGSGKRSEDLIGYTLPLHDPEGIIPWVAREGRVVLANNVKKDKRYRPSPQPPDDTKSELCVPLLYDQEVVGVLDIQSNKYNAFTEDDQRMFEAVADNIATAIHNADLYRTEQWRRQVADGLREVAGLISAEADLDDVLEAILSELDRNLSVDISAIWLLEDDELYLAASHNVDEAHLEQTLYDSPSSYEALMRVINSDEPLIRKPTDPIWVSGLAGGFEQNYSALAVPLRLGDQPLGVITLAHSAPGKYGHEAQAMTTTFASYAAVAIENARLYDAAQEQAYASAALLQVAQAIVSLSDLDEILGTIIRIMPILVGVQRAALYQWDAEKELFRPSQEYGLSDEDENRFWERSFAHGEFAFLDACRDSTGLLACQVESPGGLNVWLSVDPAQDVNLGSPRALLFAVPIAVKDDLYGVMMIEEAPGGLRFRSRRLEIITGIAQQAALAIQNDLLQKAMFVRERL
ncbi:MAG TPA: GAF domain-containing protein, partial [Anaerolineales bacterium]|nr:GAF domain-containing protein [Anaerolineales bacterium]